MAKNYGVLRGKVDRGQREDERSSPHYQLRVLGQSGERWRIPVNVKSTVGSETDPTFSEVLYYVNDQFSHVQLADFARLPVGFSPLGRGEGLDYIRGNLFDRSMLRHLPATGPAANDDLQDIVGMWTTRAITDQADCFAFGSPWSGGDRQKIDTTFETDRGVHLIHMNQGSRGKFSSDNSVWTDGGLLFFFPATQRWVSIFLAFQSQSWHTDDRTGNALEDVVSRDAEVLMLAAAINPPGREEGQEAVVLLNTSGKSRSLAGWSLVDKQGLKESLDRVQLAAGEARTLKLSGRGARLPNGGGSLTLLDDQGLKVHGVTYTQEEASVEGRTIVFRSV